MVIPTVWIIAAAGLAAILGMIIFTRKQSLLRSGRATFERQMKAGTSALDQGNVAAAERSFIAAQQRASSLGEGRQAMLSVSVLSLAKCCAKTQRWDDAERHAHQACELLELPGNPHAAKLSEALAILTDVYLNRLELDRAEDNLRRALAVARERSGERSEQVAEHMGVMADFLSKIGRYADAISFYNEAIALHDRLGNQSPQKVPSLLLRLSVALMSAGRHTESLPALKRGMAWAERFHGEDSVEASQFLSSLAEAQTYGGNLAAAADLFERAARIRENKLGPDHPEVAVSLGGHADTLRKLRRYEDAERVATKALKIQEKVADPSRYNTLEILAQIKFERGEHGHADEYFTDALAALQQAVGDETLEVAEYLEKHAVIKKRLGQAQMAEAMNVRANQIRRNWAELHC